MPMDITVTGVPLQSLRIPWLRREPFPSHLAQRWDIKGRSQPRFCVFPLNRPQSASTSGALVRAIRNETYILASFLLQQQEQMVGGKSRSRETIWEAFVLV